jgi:D-alanine-D-alanine ligase
MKNYKVAVLVNTKEISGKYVSNNDEAKAELDPMHTAKDYAEALSKYGHEVYLCEGTSNLLNELAQIKPDICFNTCEGFQGESREAQIPAMLELAGYKYTGPTPTSAIMTQNKPKFQVFETADDPINSELTYPLFVKPSHEGSGKGVKSDCIVNTRSELQKKVAEIISKFNQPALVEEFIDGRDFTCGLVGNGDDIHVFPVSEIQLTHKNTQAVYGMDEKFINVEEYMGICPAHLSDQQTRQIKDLTVKTFNAVMGRDYARVDFRMNTKGKIYVLEINGLPGISMVSDLTLTAYAEDWTYAQLVESVLEAGLKRYKML